MSTDRIEWDCCGSVTETEAWSPSTCPICALGRANDSIAKARAALLRIWPDGETCQHADVREAFRALGGKP